jgi:hypothetical protein
MRTEPTAGLNSHLTGVPGSSPDVTILKDSFIARAVSSTRSTVSATDDATLIATLRSTAAIWRDAGTVIVTVPNSSIDRRWYILGVSDPAASQPTFHFEAPAVPDAIAWARTFAASIAVSAGADPETVADLRLAISELMSGTVVRFPGQRVDIGGWLEDGDLSLHITPWTDVEPVYRALTPMDIVSSLFETELLEDSIVLHVSVTGT